MTTLRRSNWYHNLRIPLERFGDFFERENVLEVAKGNAEVPEVTEISNLHSGRLPRRLGDL